MQLKEKHRRLMAVLARDDRVGVSMRDLSDCLDTFTSLQISATRWDLQEAGYAEERMEGEPWPNERQSPDARPRTPRRRFRLTAKGKAAFNR